MIRFVLLLTLALSAAPVLAQARLSHVGIFSLLGDSVQVASNTAAPTDTRIERMARDSMQFKGLDLDVVATREAERVLRTGDAKLRMALLRSPAPLTPEQQREIAEGASQGGLPGWMVQAITQRGFSHVLLLSRSRGEISARTTDGHGIGRGVVDGIGFYLDTLYKIRNQETGAVHDGLIAPYAKIKLQLLDTQTAEVVWSDEVDRAVAIASVQHQTRADPWSFISEADKIVLLRRMVSEGVADALGRFVAKQP